MKPLSIIIMLSISLCATLCCPEEDGRSAINFTVENNNLILVENNTDNFNLDSQMIIEMIIDNNQLTTSGDPILLSDLFYDDVLSDSFLYHSLALYKETGFGTLSKISVTNANIETTEGIAESFGETIELRSVYNSNTNTFRNKFAISLRELGTFYLSNNRYDFDGIKISGGIYELGLVTITTTINNSNTEGGYKFTVD
jgi:hypothetical protein